MHYFTLWHWPLTFDLEHLQRIACDVMKLYQIWTQSSNLRRSYCDFNVWPYELEHCVTCHAGLWDNFSPSLTFDDLYIRVWIIVFLMMIRYVTHLDLWPVDLESSWDNKRHVIKVCTKFERNRAIPGWIIDNLANFCTGYVTLWPWPLISWHLTFTELRVSCLQNLYKIWAKSSNLWLSYWRFSTFSQCNFKDEARLTNGSQGCVDPTSRGHRAIIPTQEFCFGVRISCCIFKREQLKVEWC